MAPDGIVPGWLLSSVAVATLWVVMFDLGLAIVIGEFRWVIHRPALVLKALFSVLICVPCIVWVVARIFDLPRNVEIGMMVMAIAPGAPVALRRSLGAGGIDRLRRHCRLHWPSPRSCRCRCGSWDSISITPEMR